MKTSILIRITHFIVLVAFVSAGLWLFDKNFPFSGTVVVTEIFGKHQPTISSLGPSPRLKLDAGTQIMLEGPVYFDVRAPHWFHHAEIVIEYREEGRHLSGIGGLVAEPWTYQLKPFDTIIELNDGWKRGTVEFDLAPLLSVKNVKRFLLDTVGQTGLQLRLRSLVVTFKR